MVKMLFFLLVITVLSLPAHTQDTLHFYLDSTGTVNTTPEKSSYHFKIYLENGTYRVDKYETVSGFLYETLHFKDKALSVMHGRYISYSNPGQVEEEGEYNDGKKHLLWKTYNKNGNLSDSIFYTNDMVYEIHHYKNGKLSHSEKGSQKFDYYYYPDGKIWQKHSWGEKMQLSVDEYSPEGRLLSKEETEALSIARAAKFRDSIKKAYKPVEVPEYPSGQTGFQRYIDKEIKIPMRAIGRHLFPCTYRAILYFNEKGDVENIKVTKSVNPDFDNSVSSSLKRMPRWEMHGRKQYTLPLTINFLDE